jgi:hypothetical protein
MKDPQRDQAWSDFSARLYELAVSSVRVSASDNEATRQEHGAALAEVFFSATALAVEHRDALKALTQLRESLGSVIDSVESDLVRCKRIRADDVSGRMVGEVVVEQPTDSPSNDVRVQPERRLT